MWKGEKYLSYYEDLTLYEYFPDCYIKGTVNIGWLDINYSFSKGKADREFAEKLCNYFRIQVALARGYHCCEFCSTSNMAPYVLNKNGIEFTLGRSEIRVLGKAGRIYAAPTLIYHYIVDHEYKPPEEFIQAVLEGPSPESSIYEEFLCQNKILHPRIYEESGSKWMFK